MGKKWKIMFPVLLLAVTCITGQPGAKETVYAAEEEEIGSYDFLGTTYYYFENWEYWVKKDGTLQLDHYYGEAPEVLEIPAKISGKAVTSIDESVFSLCGESDEVHKTKTLIIPETLTDIPYRSFKTLHNLEEIIVEEGNAAYRSEDGVMYDKDMKTLEVCPRNRKGSLTIPDGIEKIARLSFYDSALSEICLPESLKEIEGGAFEGCSNLTGIALPESIEEIGRHAFLGCEKLREIIVPEGINAISDAVFWDCRALSSVRLPESLKSIEPDAFRKCGSLENIVIPNKVTMIRNYAFSECSRLKSIRIPDSVRQIGSKAFFESDKAVIECSSNSYAQKYAQKNNIPYRIISSASGKRLGLLFNGQSVKNAQKFKVKVKKGYTLQAVRGTEKAAVKWKSSNTKVAAVKNGKVKVKKAGKAVVTATALNGKKVSVTLSAAKAAVKVTKVQVTGSKTMKKGNAQILNLAVVPASADNTKVSWNSSNPKVVTADRRGKVTAKKKGTAVITATAKDGSKKKGSIKITVK